MSLGIGSCFCNRSITETCLDASCISECHGDQKKITPRLAMFLLRFQGGSALNIDGAIPIRFMQELKRPTTFHATILFSIHEQKQISCTFFFSTTSDVSCIATSITSQSQNDAAS
jgi:hypothetical protein